MFLLIASNAMAAMTAPSPPPAQSHSQATATVRIERPAIANSKEWDRAPKAGRREIVRRDEGGQTVLLRLVEYQ